jgi:hypothetical protein
MFFVAMSGVLLGQSDTASISGYVRDPSGAGIPSAKVTVRSEATGMDRPVEADSAGYYVVSALQPGLYTVEAQAAGFKRLQKVHSKLDPNIPREVDLTLEVGVVAESVVVTASVANVQTDSSTLGKLVEGKQISDLQLNGRNPIFLAMLKPGVQRNGLLAGLSFAVDNGSFSINGSRGNDNLITYDGAVAVRTRGNNTSVGVADLDSVQEVQVLTANYSAEYGRSNGGQIRIITKSGTREFHGSAYEYFRNSALNANSWSRNLSASTNFTSPERYNQFGWNLGGPVVLPKASLRDKLFFYVSQEFLRRRLDSTAMGTVPTELMRAGNFSELLAPNPFLSGTKAIKDPSTGAVFPGNIIPRQLLSSNGLALLRVYPERTPGFLSGTRNWIAAGSSPVDQRKETFAIDLLPASQHSIRIRAMNYSYNDSAPFGTNFALSPVTKDRPSQTGSISWTYTVTPTLVSETVASISHDALWINLDTSNGLFDRTRYGINYPFAFPGTKDLANKIPSVDIPNFTSYTGSPYPSFFSDQVFTAGNNTTKVAGSHMIKFGVLYERAAENNRDQINIDNVPGGTDNQNGRFVFSDTRTGGSGLGLADAVLGLYNTYAETGLRSYTPYRSNMFEWYVQDKWKASPKLTLEFGLRHSIIQPYYSLWRNQSLFDPSFYEPAKAVKVDTRGNPVPGSGDPLNGIVVPGSGWPDAAKGRVTIAGDSAYDRLFRGLDKSYADLHWRDFQPRVGMAYAFNPKTVWRAGAGKFVNRLGVSDSVQLGGNPPLQPFASFALGNVDSPANATGASYPLAVTTEDRTFKNPVSYAWSTTLQREIGFNTTVEVSYVGRRGLNLQREKNINQLPVGALYLPQNAGLHPNQLRPYLGYGPIRETLNDGRSIYNGLQIELNRRFSKGLSFGFAYTRSHSEDNGSNYRALLPNTYNDKFFWGSSDFDTRQIAVINGIYELPWLRNSQAPAGKLLGGWEVTAVAQFQSGLPYTVQTADDFAGVGTGSGTSIWNMSGTPAMPHEFAGSAASGQYWFVPTNPDGAAVFTAPAQGTFTSQNNRNRLYNPAFQNWNLGLFKRFRITDRQNISFRAEGFNFINHPNLSGVNSNPRSAAFGMVTGKGSERNVQLSLRYSF